jgi:hypothetical protein
MDDSQSKTKSTFTQVLRVLLRFLEFVFLLFCWLVYAFITLNRSEEALAYTGGNPMPGKYSILALALIFVFYFRKTLFVKNWSVGIILQRLLVILTLGFGLMVFMTKL